MKQKLISSPYAWFLLDFCGLDVWIQWNEFIPSPNGGIGATLMKTVIFFCEHFWKTEYEKVPSCHAVVDFFVRNCLLYENSSKNVDFHVPSCSEGSHPGWFHLAWGSNDGIWYRCRPPSANECSFQHSRVINRGIHENANNLPCTTTNATSSFISTTRGSNSVTGQFSKPWPTLTNHLF